MNSKTVQPPLEEVRANMHAQAVKSALHILGPRRGRDATALANLIVAYWETISAASAELFDLENVGLDQLPEEMRKRTEKLVTTATVNVSVLALEALAIAVHGNRHTKQ